jgi:hypothetical protein
MRQSLFYLMQVLFHNEPSILGYNFLPSDQDFFIFLFYCLSLCSQILKLVPKITGFQNLISASTIFYGFENKSMRNPCVTRYLSSAHEFYIIQACLFSKKQGDFAA